MVRRINPTFDVRDPQVKPLVRKRKIGHEDEKQCNEQGTCCGFYQENYERPHCQPIYHKSNSLECKLHEPRFACLRPVIGPETFNARARILISGSGAGSGSPEVYVRQRLWDSPSQFAKDDLTSTGGCYSSGDVPPVDYFEVVSVSMVDDLLQDKREWQHVGGFFRPRRGPNISQIDEAKVFEEAPWRRVATPQQSSTVPNLSNLDQEANP